MFIIFKHNWNGFNFVYGYIHLESENLKGKARKVSLRKTHSLVLLIVAILSSLKHRVLAELISGMVSS